MNDPTPDFRAHEALAQPAPKPCTETIDRLFLELSQFTQATTEKELKLQSALAQPTPELPTDEELQATYLDALNGSLAAGMGAAIVGLRAVLARWGQGNG
jgi:hypothetical protein